MFFMKVGAALRPAFTPETAPDVTAAACEVSININDSNLKENTSFIHCDSQLTVITPCPL